MAFFFEKHIARGCTENMKKKLVLVGTIAVTLIAMLTGCGEKKKLSFAAGTKGGTYYKYATAISDYSKENKGIYQYEILETDGSVSNIEKVRSGEADFGIAQSNDICIDVSRAFFENGELEYSAVSALYEEAFQIVVAADSDIYTLKDMEGHLISFGPKNSGTEVSAQALLKANRIDVDSITVVNESFTQSAEDFEQGNIDGFVMMAGTPTAALTDIADAKAIRIISLSEEEIEALMKDYSGYVPVTIPANTYNGMDEPAMTVGITAVLIVNNKVKDKVVGDLLRDMFSNANTLGLIGSNQSYTRDYAIKNLPIKLHGGAAAFFNK